MNAKTAAAQPKTRQRIGLEFYAGRFAPTFSFPALRLAALGTLPGQLTMESSNLLSGTSASLAAFPSP